MRVIQKTTVGTGKVVTIYEGTELLRLESIYLKTIQEQPWDHVCYLMSRPDGLTILGTNYRLVELEATVGT